MNYEDMYVKSAQLYVH